MNYNNYNIFKKQHNAIYNWIRIRISCNVYPDDYLKTEDFSVYRMHYDYTYVANSKYSRFREQTKLCGNRQTALN